MPPTGVSSSLDDATEHFLFGQQNFWITSRLNWPAWWPQTNLRVPLGPDEFSIGSSMKKPSLKGRCQSFRMLLWRGVSKNEATTLSPKCKVSYLESRVTAKLSKKWLSGPSAGLQMNHKSNLHVSGQPKDVPSWIFPSPPCPYYTPLLQRKPFTHTLLNLNFEFTLIDLLLQPPAPPPLWSCQEIFFKRFKSRTVFLSCLFSPSLPLPSLNPGIMVKHLSPCKSTSILLHSILSAFLHITNDMLHNIITGLFFFGVFVLLSLTHLQKVYFFLSTWQV